MFVPQGHIAEQLLPWAKDPDERMFGTHWCGPGGSGPTVNNLDKACQAHDFCYDANGLSALSNYNTGLSQQKFDALQQCNQQLCNAARTWASKDRGSSRVDFYFSSVPIGTCHGYTGVH